MIGSENKRVRASAVKSDVVQACKDEVYETAMIARARKKWPRKRLTGTVAPSSSLASMAGKRDARQQIDS